MSEDPTIILRKKLSTSKPTADAIRKGNVESVQKVGSGKNNQGYYNPTIQRKLDDDSEAYAVPTSTPDIAQTIRDKRGTTIMPDGKVMSQADLARKCNLPVSVIKDYESGKAVLKQTEISLINKVLGTHIKIPKTKKAT